MVDDGKTLSARAEELRQETAALNVLLSGYASRAEVQAQLAAEREKTRQLVGQRNAAAAGVLVAVVSVLAVIGFAVFRLNVATSAARQAVERVDADRKERARGSCIQFNVNQRNQRSAIVAGLVDTFRPLVGAGREAEFDVFAASLRSNVDSQLRYRDCSDLGIEAFLKSPPLDPATGG